MFHESNRLSVKVRTNATMPIHTYTTYLDMRCWIPHFPLRCNPTHGCNMSCNVSKSPPAKRPACVARRIEYRPRAEILSVCMGASDAQPANHTPCRARGDAFARVRFVILFAPHKRFSQSAWRPGSVNVGASATCCVGIPIVINKGVVWGRANGAVLDRQPEIRIQ